MRQRVAIAISAVVAAMVLAVGLTAAGFGPEPRSTPVTAVEPMAAVAVPAEASGEDAGPEIVYIEPAPKPRTVVVKQRTTQGTGSASHSGKRSGVTRSGVTRFEDDDDDRREHRRESAKERREDVEERREHEGEHEHEDDD